MTTLRVPATGAAARVRGDGTGAAPAAEVLL
jgi:hypothetical protein